jgi:amidase/aspartyl-tRNA(Asn)/glutamyl-tRNA(Gln) amidotransferase subunit A
MPRDSDLSAAEIRALAAETGVSLNEGTAAEFVDPVCEILDSMDPVEHIPDRSPSVDSITVADRSDPHNAFITSCRVERDGASGPLDVYTVALKDNIALAGVPLTAGSGMLEGYVPERNAAVTDRLLNDGATIVGKANMDEFAFGPTGETSFYGPTENPHSPEHTPGGSSSGSAAAVAAGDADFALGTDTGGSVRIPASYCGVFGLKPTHGLIPTTGIIELAGSLDTVGVLSQDLETLTDGFATLADDWDRPETLDGVSPESLTLGVPDSLFEDPVRPAVAEHISAAVGNLTAAGASETPISLPSTTVSSAVWRALTMSELFQYFVANALPYRSPDGERPPYSAAFRGASEADIDRLSGPLKQYLVIGAYLVTEDGGRRYGNALDVQRTLTERVDAAFEEVDVLVSPATPTTAFEFGAFSRDSSPPINNNTHLFNITGHPAITIPSGTIDSLPIGVQVVGEHGADTEVLRVARTITETVDAA